MFLCGGLRHLFRSSSGKVGKAWHVASSASNQGPIDAGSITLKTEMPNIHNLAPIKRGGYHIHDISLNAFGSSCADVGHARDWRHGGHLLNVAVRSPPRRCGAIECQRGVSYHPQIAGQPAEAYILPSPLPPTPTDEATWLLHRDITYALLLPILEIHTRAVQLATSILQTRNKFDLELAFRGEARGAFSWLQCFLIEEDDWCQMRGCPACTTLHALSSEPPIRLLLLATRFSPPPHPLAFFQAALRAALHADPFWGPAHGPTSRRGRRRWREACGSWWASVRAWSARWLLVGTLLGGIPVPSLARGRRWRAVIGWGG
ncbi:MAG: hypothetical protein FRX48_08118 [Lasallia pustulata]|uniref:Uncharacterized protein n=1 Tax=Lasallia pustulata TaxID=136370 RepID=A0A5M8PHP8_9LECA|nr:MAG: hypothetical protein FRX48_08118 [Lasallia pustulata]